jgi:RNA-binding protein
MVDMRRLGKVLQRSGIKNLIVKGDEIKSDNTLGNLPKLNSIVVDKALNQIGVIVSVFGPVNQPYFFVKGFKRIPDSEFRIMVNEKVYIR